MNDLDRRRRRLQLSAILIALSVAIFFYRWLVLKNLEQTAALFVGIPLLIVIGVSLAPPAKSMVGLLVQVSLGALALAGIVLPEGRVCLLMALPIFLLIAVIFGWVIDKSRAKKPKLSLFLLALPMAFEGVTPGLSFDRKEDVRVSRVVSLPVTEVEKRLAAAPNLRAELPNFLKLGFPKASNFRGTGLHVGQKKCVHFSGGEGSPGDLCFEVTDRKSNEVSFSNFEDKSHVSHWLDWERTRIQWQAVSPGQTRIVMQFEFTRRLDPAWYFSPLERYGVEKAGEHLMAAYFDH